MGYIFPVAALKILVIRKYYLRFLPCYKKNLLPLNSIDLKGLSFGAFGIFFDEVILAYYKEKKFQRCRKSSSSDLFGSAIVTLFCHA